MGGTIVKEGVEKGLKEGIKEGFHEAKIVKKLLSLVKLYGVNIMCADGEEVG